MATTWQQAIVCRDLLFVGICYFSGLIVFLDWSLPGLAFVWICGLPDLRQLGSAEAHTGHADTGLFQSVHDARLTADHLEPLGQLTK